jgi:uncharacterized protein (TIGR02246 family)
MPEEPNALEARIAALEARLELYQMFSALAPVIDSGADRGVAEFFAADAEYRTDVPGVTPALGRDAIEQIFRAPMHTGLIQSGISHALSFPHVTIEGDQATVIAHSVVHLRDEHGWHAARVAANRFSCVRRDGRWEITARDNMQLGAPAARDLFGDAPYDLPWR